MKKTTTKKTLNLRAVKEYIRRQHATWEMVEDHFQFDRVTIQRKLKADYKLDSAYKKLLAEVRENTRLKREADALIPPSMDVSTPRGIVVVETGYLMKVGLDDLLNTNQDIVIPEFCVGELKKLSQSSTAATKALALVRQKSDEFNGPITLLKLEENVLVEEPILPMKRRSIGIVAVCCDVYAVTPVDRQICLLTTSYEVEQLANAQGFGPNVTVKRHRDTNS